ncbi:alginate export family protein [Ferrimonas sediminum]
MMKLMTLAASLALALTPGWLFAATDPVANAITSGKATLDLRMRYENVQQDNPLKDADALTLRTRLTYETGAAYGFSALVEFEDSRQVFGVDDYDDGLESRPDYSVIADPETTELDQALLQYKNRMMTIKLGRQVIAWDNQRFVGHVGWRQDRQTFDGATIGYTPMKNLSLNYGYLSQRNRIFAEERDVNADDHLLNASYKTDFGTLVGYGYLLEVDDNTDNDLDTWGVRFAGNTDLRGTTVSYAAEWATQESDSAGTSFDADYWLLEGGVGLFGLKATLGYEVLGSDSGNYGFATPLATLHKFNGWADQFLTTPSQGLEDLYLTLTGQLPLGTWTLAYHDFDAEQSTPGVSDLGDEWNLQYTTKFAKHYNGGIKYATYSAGDAASDKVDTDKLWLWVGAHF